MDVLYFNIRFDGSNAEKNANEFIDKPFFFRHRAKGAKMSRSMNLLKMAFFYKKMINICCWFCCWCNYCYRCNCCCWYNYCYRCTWWDMSWLCRYHLFRSCTNCFCWSLFPGYCSLMLIILWSQVAACFICHTYGEMLRIEHVVVVVDVGNACDYRSCSCYRFSRLKYTC